MGSGRYNTGKEDDLIQQIIDLRRRVADLESGNRIGSTSIDRGTLTVLSGASINVRRPFDNAPVVRVGDLQDLDLWGFSAFNPNPDFPVQNPLFEVGASDPGGVFPDGVVNIIDRKGNFVFTLGFPFGLGEPTMSHNFIATSTLSTPSQSTTSGSFTPLWSSSGWTMHPSIHVHYIIQCDVGTSAEVRLRDAFNSNPTTLPTVYGAGAYSFGGMWYEHQSSSTPGEPFAGMIFQTELEARRTGGAGAVRVQQIFAAGYG